MNKLRRTCAVTILTVALATSALAGIMDSPGVAAPPPPSATPTTSTDSTSGSTTEITTTIILTIVGLISLP